MLSGFLLSTWNVAALLSRFLKPLAKMKLKPVDGPTREILYAFAFLWGRSYYHSYQPYRLHLVDVPLHASVFLLYSPFVEASESCKNKTHNPGPFFSMRASTMSIHFSLLSLAGCGEYSHPCVTCSAESENRRHCFTFRTGIHSLYIFTFSCFWLSNRHSFKASVPTTSPQIHCIMLDFMVKRCEKKQFNVFPFIFFHLEF